MTSRVGLFVFWGLVPLQLILLPPAWAIGIGALIGGLFWAVRRELLK